MLYKLLSLLTFQKLPSSQILFTVWIQSKIIINQDKENPEIIDIQLAFHRTVNQLWSITEDLNVLYKDNWTRLAAQEVKQFQVNSEFISFVDKSLKLFLAWKDLREGNEVLVDIVRNGRNIQ